MSVIFGRPGRPQFQGEELKARVMPPCVKGEKVACLAITEPTAGSDVANLKCSAKLEGDFYILNPGAEECWENSNKPSPNDHKCRI